MRVFTHQHFEEVILGVIKNFVCFALLSGLCVQTSLPLCFPLSLKYLYFIAYLGICFNRIVLFIRVVLFEETFLENQ